MTKKIEFERKGGPYDIKQPSHLQPIEVWFYTNGGSATVVIRTPVGTESCRIPLRTLKKIVEAMS